MTKGASNFFPAIGSKFNTCHDASGQFCSGGSGTMDIATGKLNKLANTPRREALVVAFREEFPKALATVGLKPSDIQGITVYGSFASPDISDPNDLDIVVKVPNNTKIPMGGLFDMTAWPQGKHKVPIAFAKPAIYNKLVDSFRGGIEGKVKVEPISIFSK